MTGSGTPALRNASEASAEIALYAGAAGGGEASLVW